LGEDYRSFLLLNIIITPGDVCSNSISGSSSSNSSSSSSTSSSSSVVIVVVVVVVVVFMRASDFKWYKTKGICDVSYFLYFKF